MKPHRFISALLLILCAVPAKGQLLNDVDMLLKNNQARQVYDTTYIYRPQNRFLIRTQSIFSGESFALTCPDGNGGDYFMKVGSQLQFKQTIGFGYRSIVLDAGFVPGKKSSIALDLKINGNRIGVSAGGSISYGMSGSASHDGITEPVPERGIIGLYSYLNAYYAFNGGRFSMPAATNQNYRQLRSAGSVLASFAAQFYGMAPDRKVIPDSPAKVIFTSLLGLGGGYGYNWVPNEHWLVHLSLTETVGILNDSRIYFSDSDLGFKEEVPVFVTAGNVAVLYYWGNWYFGLYSKADNLSFFGKKGISFSLNRTSSLANLTVGVRF